MLQEITLTEIGVLLTAVGVFLAAIGIIYGSRQIKTGLENAVKAIHEDIRRSQRKLERKIKQ